VGRVWPRHGRRGRPLNSVVSCHSMKLSTNVALWGLAVLAAAVLEQVIANPAYLDGPMGAFVEGEVLSVDPSPSDAKTGASRKATVKLRTGEIVRATVGGCIVFPGQTARLSKYGRGPGAAYIVSENGRNDS
jgi:hypothetical protein